MKKSVLNQNGSALLIALLIMLMLTLIFAAAVTTSVTDLDIARNQKERTLAFYTAEAGLQLALGVLRTNCNELNNDTLESYINGTPCIGEGSFTVDVSGTYPYKTLSSTGYNRDGKSTVEVTVRRKRTPLCIWDNIVFGGTGEAGGGGIVSGNANLHGSVHILGEDQGPEDIVLDMDGSVGIYNNYTGINASLSTRMPPLDTITFNGEVVGSLNSEIRVKHGMVNVGAFSSVGFPNVPAGSPPVKETVDGTYVTDGFGGSQGESSVYSDNGTTEKYDLGDQLELPGLYDPYTDPNTGTTYPTYMNYLSNNSLVVSGNLIVTAGQEMAPISNAYGSISMDLNGNLLISGIVYATNDVMIKCGIGAKEHLPVIFDGKGTLVAVGDVYVDTHLLSKETFAEDDILGLIAGHDIELGSGPGDANLNIMGVFFADNQILNEKQNQLAGAMASNYFKINQVPDLFQVPAVVDNLPPGMPGSETINIYTYEIVNGTWREY